MSVAASGGFVGLLSLFNMGGRFGWSATSDKIGRKPIYVLYLGLGILLYLALATIGQSAVAFFVLFAAVIISFYGGGFATVPAYLRDLFGTFQVGAIHGRLLTAWSAAGIAGPLIINGFLDAQGKPGALDASAYRPALLTMVGMLVVGLLANLLIRPVADRFHETGAVQVLPAREDSLGGDDGTVAHGGAGRVFLSWAVVLLLLGYGVVMTVLTAARLFT